MKILFIRHSLAVERDEFLGHDFDRPLTDKGKKRAKRFFEKTSLIYPKIDVIYTSTAKRALETAEILKFFYPEAKFVTSNLLLPGATIHELKKLLNGTEAEVVAVVGHEPDLSSFVKELVYAPNLKIKLQKPSLVEIEDMVLKSLLQYKHLKAIDEKNHT